MLYASYLFVLLLKNCFKVIHFFYKLGCLWSVVRIINYSLNSGILSLQKLLLTFILNFNVTEYKPRHIRILNLFSVQDVNNMKHALLLILPMSIWSKAATERWKGSCSQGHLLSHVLFFIFADASLI